MLDICPENITCLFCVICNHVICIWKNAYEKLIYYNDLITFQLCSELPCQSFTSLMNNVINNSNGQYDWQNLRILYRSSSKQAFGMILVYLVDICLRENFLFDILCQAVKEYKTPLTIFTGRSWCTEWTHTSRLVIIISYTVSFISTVHTLAWGWIWTW